MLTAIVLIAHLLFLTATSAAGNRESFPLPSGDSLNGGLSINVSKSSLTAAEFDKIVAGGYRWVRLDLDWASVEQRPGIYTWTHVDALINGMTARGIRSLVVIHTASCPIGDGGEVNLPDEIDGYARFAAAATYRYQNKGILWEIWNEPNLPHHWRGTPSPEKYMLLVKAAVTAIRAQTPDEWIAGPAVSGWDWAFYEACFDRGLLSYVDVMTTHPYRAKESPEANQASFAQLKLRIAQRGPMGKSIPVFAGETGYTDLASRSMSPDLQAQYAQRQPLANLAFGVPFSNWYNLYNQANFATNENSNYGILDAAMNPKPSYLAVKMMADALKGYRFAARLDVGSPTDYCLVFSNGLTTKIVAWTAAGTARTALLAPIKTGIFDGLRYSGNTTVTATLTGLSIPLTGHPIILTPRIANPALTLCGAWAPIPSTAVVASRQNAVDAFLPSLASGVSSLAPLGALISVEDVPGVMPGWNRATRRWSLTGLTGITAASPAVQQIFNEMPSAQERLQKNRTVRVSLQMPDGTKFTQVCSVSTKNPLSLTALASLDGKMLMQLDNPTGRALNGKVVVTNATGTLSQTVAISMPAGQPGNRFAVPGFTKDMMEAGFSASVFDFAGESTDTSKPVAQTNLQKTVHFPTMGTGAYGWEMLGDVNVPGSLNGYVAVGLPWGTAPAAGHPALQLSYSMGTDTAKGWKYFNVYPPSNLITTYIANPVATVGAWIYGDGSGMQISTLVNDESGQRFKCYGPSVTWTGWRWTTVAIDPANAERWGGANDGIIHGRIAVRTPFVFDSGSRKVSGTIQISGVMVTSYVP
jgi:hypothetical protein